MGNINVLSFEIANLIAAGEVVERPSSVLKELIENAIDAGSTKIVAEIKRGGVALIRVSDNGVGMSKEDLPISIKRHATSKIRTKEDLDGIITLGFRGEALAAISSVSAVTIITKRAEDEIGSMLVSEGGEILEISEVGAADGTTVVVENLFFNVPARRKFLKKDATEAMNVSALVERVALSRPDISIQLLIDGEEKFRTPGDGDLLHTVQSVLGRDFASKTISVDGETSSVRVHGLIGRSDNVRKNRNLENFFINGRYIKSLTAQAALEKAFTSYIAPECFPACVLFLEMNPALIDVNVHPTKLEVKFSDERSVFEAVYYTVKNALEESAYRPELALGGAKTGQRGYQNPMGAFVPVEDNRRTSQMTFATQETPKMPAYEAPREQRSTQSQPVSSRESRAFDERFSLLGRPSTSPTVQVADPSPSKVTRTTPTYEHHASTTSEQPKKSATPSATPRLEEMSPKASLEIIKTATELKTKEEPTTPLHDCFSDEMDYRYVGEAFDTYVMVEYDGALLVIDKHAAHERIIFEDLKKNRALDSRSLSQTLLVPISLSLTPEELEMAREHKDEIEYVGFSYQFVDRGIELHAIPDMIEPDEAKGLFEETLGDLISAQGDPTVNDEIRREKALYQIACKAAIKGGRVYDKSVIDWLIKRVLSLPDITVCPHGRPIAYRLTKRELDRQFDRIK